MSLTKDLVPIWIDFSQNLTMRNCSLETLLFNGNSEPIQPRGVVMKTKEEVIWQSSDYQMSKSQTCKCFLNKVNTESCTSI